MNALRIRKPTRTRFGTRPLTRGLALPLALLCAAAWTPCAATTPTSSANYVYVESNIGTPGGNTVLGFSRDSSGNLTPLPGSPYSTGGTGVVDLSLALGPFDSDQNVIVSPDGKRLFAVNGGSDSIAVFNIHSDGSLLPVPGSPFPSNGIDPVSVGLAGNLLIVVNKSMDPAQNATDTYPNYTTFHVNSNGSLSPVGDSTVPVAMGSSPSQALVSPNRHFVFGADFFGGLIQSFRIQPGGTLEINNPQTIPASEFLGGMAPTYVLGLATHPTWPVLYVGYVALHTVGIYYYDSQGRLTFANSVPDSGAGICWVHANQAGTRLYAVNTGDNSISVFDITDPFFPDEIQHLVMKSNGGSPFQPILAPDGSSLYVISQRANAMTPLGSGNGIHVLQIASDGTLTEAASSPLALTLPSGTRPQGIAAVSIGTH